MVLRHYSLCAALLAVALLVFAAIEKVHGPAELVTYVRWFGAALILGPGLRDILLRQSAARVRGE